MKRIAIIIITSIITFQMSGQTRALQADEAPWGVTAWEHARATGRHMVFDGVSLGKPMGETLDLLRARGWRTLREERTYVIMSGDWMGYADTRIAVHHKNGKAYLVEVYPKAALEWETARKQYETARNAAIKWSGRDEAYFDDCTDHNLNISHRKGFKMDKVHRDFLEGNSVYNTVIPLYEGRIEVEVTGKDHVVNPIARHRRGRFQTRAIYRDIN